MVNKKGKRSNSYFFSTIIQHYIGFFGKSYQKSFAYAPFYIVFLITLTLPKQSEGQITTEGEEFWLGFMENTSGPEVRTPFALEIYISSKQPASGTIEIFEDGNLVNFSVEPGEVFKHTISAQALNPYAASGSGRIQRKAVKIKSDVNINVYAANTGNQSADATVVLPTSAIGKRYYASSYFEDVPDNDAWGSRDSPSQVLIVAVANDTEIEITPSVDTADGHVAGETYTITLNEGDIYQITARADLTGTFIETKSTDVCKNIAVFGGNKHTRVTGGQDCRGFDQNGNEYTGGHSRGHLFEQMYPIETWGSTYATVPYQNRNSYVLHFSAAEEDTKISVLAPTKTESFALDAGESKTLVFEGHTQIFGSKPFQLAQLSQSLSCDYKNVRNTGGIGDSHMTMLNHRDQLQQKITISALPTYGTILDDYQINLIVPPDDLNTVTINGTRIPPSAYTAITAPLGPRDPFFYHTTIDLTRGENYIIESTGKGFNAYLHGAKYIEAIGYAVGTSLEDLNLQIKATDEIIGLIDESACKGSEIEFEAIFDVISGTQPRYNTFEWDFGDGTNGTGKTSSHIYENPGNYTIKMRASDGRGSCAIAEIIKRTITIEEAKVDLLEGPQSVCPGVNNVEYRATGTPENEYIWKISGGEITTDNNDKILVSWGNINSEAYIEVTPVNSLGCIGEPERLDVKIEKLLSPKAPQALVGLDSEVCFADHQNVTYYTPLTPNSRYEWFIEGGQIIDSNNSNQVTVAWNGTGSGKLWYQELNTNVTDCQAGNSEVLEVNINAPIEAQAVVTHISCKGENDGQIVYDLDNSTHSISWSNGVTGNNISGLPPGIHSARIINQIGCELNQTFNIIEPEELTFNNTTTTHISCYGQNDGIISVEVTGGTQFADNLYQYHWFGEPSSGIDLVNNQSSMQNLPAGFYRVTVTDMNGCSIFRDFNIEEPPALEPDLNSIINAPICPDATNGKAYIDAKGGTPDYQFYWSNAPDMESQEATGLNQGTYTVRIVDAMGCETSHTITKRERLPKIYMPNAFSPNGDGVNDSIRPITECPVDYSLQIFNRWGKVLFSTQDVFQAWDGTFEGDPIPEGKYTFLLFYSGELNGVKIEENIKGSIWLYR